MMENANILGKSLHRYKRTNWGLQYAMDYQPLYRPLKVPICGDGNPSLRERAAFPYLNERSHRAFELASMNVTRKMGTYETQRFYVDLKLLKATAVQDALRTRI